MAVEHPTHDTFWHERDTRVRLGVVDIPVYLGCDWDNAPLHLPCTFGAWKALKHNPNVCMSLLAPGGLTWPSGQTHLIPQQMQQVVIVPPGFEELSMDAAF
jgi:hypothetical protein